jgi:2',3'-cyclic-nucleotide 2'-phosphodiesterase (5'-nucleotidase family)
MKRKYILIAFASISILCSSCASHYVLTGVERSRVLIDKSYDAHHDAQAEAFMKPYSHVVDSIMTPVVGITAKALTSYRPESPLSNLLADILLAQSAAFNEKVDFAVYNMGGIRSAFPKGNITYGDVVDVAPFENKICFVTLTGDKVLQLFREMAETGGEAVSKGVHLEIANHKLLSCSLNGEEIDSNKNYRVATLDYIAQGNDHLEAFKAGTNVVAPNEEKNNVRYLIIDYLKGMMAKGIIVDSNVEGRIIRTK